MPEPADDESVVAALAAALASAGRMPATPSASAAWLELVTQGRKAWPDLEVDCAQFAHHVARHLPGETTDLPTALKELYAADLYLAFACAAGVAGAFACFDLACSVAVDATIARVDRSPTFRDEVRQALRARLFVGATGDTSRIANYAGRGPLVAWAAIATRRVALSLRRGQDNRIRIEDRAMAEAIDVDRDPELEYLKRRYHNQFELSLRAAMNEISDRDRTLLRLNLIEGMTLDRLGVMFGVNASTVSRWLTRARAAILQVTEERLRQALNVSPSEFASLARLVVSQIDVSIAALFDARVHRS